MKTAMNNVDDPPVIRDGARMCSRCLDNTAEVIEAPDIHEAVHPARAEALIDLAELDLTCERIPAERRLR
jgi:hypothetical protein